MSWIERAIEALSPRWAASRAFFQMQIEAARAYDGAKVGRRQNGWSRPSTAANAEIAAAGDRLRNGARDLVRNNPFGKKAKRVYVANMVGTGITPRADTGSKARDKKINAAFERWRAECDAAGLLDFYGLQGLIVGALFESGEALIRYRDRLPSDGLTIPMQLQVLEPDYLDTTRYGRPMADANNVINQGIEFDPLGRRAAYYLWSQHPGETTILLGIKQLLTSTRVPADQIAHVYRLDRPGQIRGVTEYAASMQRSHDLAEYDEAQLVAKKIAACFGAIVTRDGSVTTPLAGTGATKDAAGRRLETLSPGMIQYAAPGDTVNFPTPPQVPDYREYTMAQLHAIAAGLGVTYEEMTGDWSNVNYSSFRAGQNGFRRAIEMDQWLMLIPMFCEPAWRRFVDRLAIAGIIDRPAYGVEWETPRFESVDPVKDATADQMDVRSGFTSLPKVIQRRGYNPDDMLEEIAAFNARVDELGLVLDSDPRKVSAVGKAQVTKDATETDPPASDSQKSLRLVKE